MTLDATLAAIKLAAPPQPGGISLRAGFSPEFPAFRASWLDANSIVAEADGDDEQDALDNLLLVLQGNEAQVARRIRLRRAQAEEIEALAAAAVKTAEREVIEAEGARA